MSNAPSPGQARVKRHIAHTPETHLVMISGRLQYDVLFVHRVHSEKVDSPFLPQSFTLHVPSRLTRSVSDSFFYVPFARVGTVKRGMFVRGPRAINDFSSTCHVDAFHDAPGAFRSAVVAYVKRL